MKQFINNPAKHVNELSEPSARTSNHQIELYFEKNNRTSTTVTTTKPYHPKWGVPSMGELTLVILW
jgi:hypothetical protein